MSAENTNDISFSLPCEVKGDGGFSDSHRAGNAVDETLHNINDRFIAVASRNRPTAIRVGSGKSVMGEDDNGECGGKCGNEPTHLICAESVENKSTGLRVRIIVCLLVASVEYDETDAGLVEIVPSVIVA